MKTGLNKEEKKEVMQQMKTDVKADIVDVIMETIKRRNNINNRRTILCKKI